MTKAISNGIGILLRYLVKEVANKKLKIKQENEEETEKKTVREGEKVRQREKRGNRGEEG